MIKQLVFLLLFLVPVFSFSAVKSDAILGTWMTEIKDAKIDIYQKYGKFYGRVVWIAEPNDENGKPVVDENNPNIKLKSRPVLKMDILLGFVYDNNGEWDGKIYDPKEGKTYTCKLWISDSYLKVRAYSGWLFQTKTWTKA